MTVDDKQPGGPLPAPPDDALIELGPLAAGEPAPRPERFADLWVLLRNPLGVVGVAVIVLTVLTALVGPLIWSTPYAAQDFRRLLGMSGAHPLGTDQLGRDVFARVVHGAQVSLQVGLVAVAIALVLGIMLGVVAAFYRGLVDGVLMRVVDILFAVPSLVLAILVAGLLGPSRTNAMIAIGIVFAPAFARVIRASALSVMARPYVEAARALGVSDVRIMTRHVLRNILGPVIVLCTVYMSSAILTEAALSFLGLGTQPPEPSWGSMLKDSMPYMQVAPWLAIGPGVAIMIVVLGLNFLGDGLRDVLDPKVRDA
jgi:peptide/nickel transport system permease protein